MNDLKLWAGSDKRMNKRIVAGPGIADSMRSASYEFADAAEDSPHNAADKFTKLFLAPACLLAAHD